MTIKPDYSPINLLGKLFFRRAAPWQQRNKMIIVLYTIAVGLVGGAAILACTWFANDRH
jgi:hypothetical protein